MPTTAQNQELLSQVELLEKAFVDYIKNPTTLIGFADSARVGRNN